jgi:hypothetical protein
VAEAMGSAAEMVLSWWANCSMGGIRPWKNLVPAMIRYCKMKQM